jgi:predicted HNH restriction endonuclease
LLIEAYALRPAEVPRTSPAAEVPRRSEGALQPDDDESAYPEGAAAYREHRELERDAALSKRAKAKRLAETGKLDCDVCGFDFARIFGQLGEGFIEAHHVKPVSTLDGLTPTKLNDLALVCSNCHRMLHRAKPLLLPDELRSIRWCDDA